MRQLVRELVGRAVILGALGLIAVGISGVVAACAGATFSKAFVAGDPPTVHYSRTVCADYREYAPRARTCEQAATEHHFTEVVSYRIALGVLGGFALVGLLLVRRRHPRLLDADLLPVAFTETVAAVAFGVAAAGLIGYGVDQMALGYDGAGFSLSGGAVAAVAAVVAAARFAYAINYRNGPRRADA